MLLVYVMVLYQLVNQLHLHLDFGVPNINLNENKGLYAQLGNENVSDIDLSTANLIVGTNITGESTDGSGTLSFDLSASGISSAFYEGFDEERYSVHYSDGTIEPLTQINLF